ncbi:uncharacterized protein LOC115886037 [Sitophilus oryzae]|uniref:Uncharacterized protein LOC115886037 n=1 Tax=Sitophilus oryzae TaxID=7048 RepID=A0A6J2YCA1_SITOR|nr:uncharacterized protein LOC115886037 [Sitophilus oryzae]
MSQITISTRKKRLRPASDVIETAVREVFDKNQSIRSVASICKRARTQKEDYRHRPNIVNKRIFSLEQEKLLVDYLKTSSKMCYGLTTVQVKELAYQYAKAQGILPKPWKEKKMTSKDWLLGFMKRNLTLNLRKLRKHFSL